MGYFTEGGAFRFRTEDRYAKNYSPDRGLSGLIKGGSERTNVHPD